MNRRKKKETEGKSVMYFLGNVNKSNLNNEYTTQYVIFANEHVICIIFGSKKEVRFDNRTTEKLRVDVNTRR